MFLLGAALTILNAYALGVVFFRKLPLPAVIIFGLGAVVESFLIYLLFLVGLGLFLPALFAVVPLLFFVRPVGYREPGTQPLDRITRWIVLPALGIFGVYYLVHALAPEIQPDATSYHLGLVAEYLRLGAFPTRIGFYEILPQGLEMLFAAAYFIGGDSAAKLVHFSFLLATVPLIVLTARRLKLSDAQGYTAAGLYFIAPVAGISGTCAYNDAALVFFTLATFYLLLLWRNHDLLAYAVAAGITAGFCYDIKFTGLIVPPLAFLFVVSHRRDQRAAAGLTVAALASIVPWMFRAVYFTCNPFAPLFSSWFPNLYFNPVTEKELAHSLSSYPGFHWPTALWEWAITGPTEGVVGPLLLAAPLALLAWRKPAGRLLLASAGLLAVPVAFNVGTRFLMPTLPFLALALTTALPRSAFLTLACLQVVFCFPPVLMRLQQPQSWILRGFPWRAALRLETESDYLRSAGGDYPVARFLESHTTAQDRVLALNGISKAFITRDVIEYWHSNRAVRYTTALQVAFSQPTNVSTRSEWAPVTLSGIRFTSNADYLREWTIFEARLYSPGGFIYASPQWHLAASTNLSDAPGAFDGNRTTSWSSRTPQRRGMFLEADFDHPQLLNAAEFLIAANAPQPGFVIEGRSSSTGKWQLLTDRFNGKVVQPHDLRQEAVHALKMAGFTAISIYANGEGLGALGRDLVLHPSQWGVRDLGAYGEFHVMQIIAP